MFNLRSSFSVILVSGSILFLSACATNNISSDAESDNDSVVSKNEKVCKSYRPTNSRIPIKDCRSAGEWAEVERTAQDKLGNMTKPQTNNPQGQ